MLRLPAIHPLSVVFHASLLLAGSASLLHGEEAGGEAFRLTETEVGRKLWAPDGREVLQYMTTKPAESKLTANSTCCFYPVRTPGGTRVIDFAPDDHKHHRGIFLAWHNMQGSPGGDFWGWGEFAPTKDRVIRNRDIRLAQADKKQAVLQIHNEWMAEEAVVLDEKLTATVREAAHSFILDLHYVLTPPRDLTLGQTAFSGFNVKSRKAKSAYTDPDGPVDRPHPHYLKPETDWPARPWYDYTFELEDGTKAGITVIDHRDNPATTWHNLQPIAMLNPCIVAPGEVKLAAGQPLHLRYRLVIHDGDVPRPVVEKAAHQFGRP